jgi:hypothetical protein
MTLYLTIFPTHTAFYLQPGIRECKRSRSPLLSQKLITVTFESGSGCRFSIMALVRTPCILAPAHRNDVDRPCPAPSRFDRPVRPCRVTICRGRAATSNHGCTGSRSAGSIGSRDQRSIGWGAGHRGQSDRITLLQDVAYQRRMFNEGLPPTFGIWRSEIQAPVLSVIALKRILLDLAVLLAASCAAENLTSEFESSVVNVRGHRPLRVRLRKAAF